jgi:hypothetical protein
VWYVRPATGGQFGPATGEIMRQWLREGRIGADSLVWREGWKDWQDASEIFPQLRGEGPVLPGVFTEPAASLTGLHSAPVRHRPRGPNWWLIGGLLAVALVLVAVVVWIIVSQSG